MFSWFFFNPGRIFSGLYRESGGWDKREWLDGGRNLSVQWSSLKIKKWPTTQDIKQGHNFYKIEAHSYVLDSARNQQSAKTELAILKLHVLSVLEETISHIALIMSPNTCWSTSQVMTSSKVSMYSYLSM